MCHFFPEMTLSFTEHLLCSTKDMKLYLLGGFLGSGKTTAIRTAVQVLQGRQRSVGIITNDQGEELVDSVYLQQSGAITGEVGGGCFCCRFDQFTGTIQSLPAQPDYLFAEAVGSCTDMVATVIKPLLKQYPHWEIRFSVFAESTLLLALLENKCSFIKEEIRYLYQKQLEEADWIIVNKSDLLTVSEVDWLTGTLKELYPDRPILFQHAHDTHSVSQWLDALEQNNEHLLRTSLDIDYNVYGRGEAALAWLDETVVLSGGDLSVSPAAGWLMERLYQLLLDRQYLIGHLKFLLRSNGQAEKVSYTQFGREAKRRMLSFDAKELDILINARIQCRPADLASLVDQVIGETGQRFGCTIETLSRNHFQPGFPTPLHRME